MAQQVEASAEGPKRVVAIAVDESENARAAFECKYISLLVQPRRFRFVFYKTTGTSFVT